MVGRVCMDALLVDVTDLPKAELADEVVLFGRQDGNQISIDEIAAKADTITVNTGGSGDYLTIQAMKCAGQQDLHAKSMAPQ